MIKDEHKLIAGIIIGIALLNFFAQYRNSKKLDDLKDALKEKK
jgi:hypothetical protein